MNFNTHTPTPTHLTTEEISYQILLKDLQTLKVFFVKVPIISSSHLQFPLLNLAGLLFTKSEKCKPKDRGMTHISIYFLNKLFFNDFIFK